MSLKENIINVFFISVIIAGISMLSLIGGTYIGKQVYGNNIRVETIEHNNTIYVNITTILPLYIQNITYDTTITTTSTTTTTTTTTTTIKRYNPASSYGLYDNSQMTTDKLGQYIINKTFGMKLRTVDGSNKWSNDNYGYKLTWIEKQEARLYLDQMEYDSNIEGVYQVRKDGTLIRLDNEDLKWNYNNGGMP